MTEPELPYAGTSGWSGSETSHDRAITHDDDGTTAAAQREALFYARMAGPRGVTVAELRREMGEHHGKVSGALSVLHMTGHLCRLYDRRDRCAIYVTPDNVEGRDTAPHGRKDPVKTALREWLEPDDEGRYDADVDPEGFVKAMRSVMGFE